MGSMEMQVVACAGQPIAAVLLYLLGMALLWQYGTPALAWLKVYRTPLLLALTIGGVVGLGGDVLLATGPGVGDEAVCIYGIQHGWPCWVLQALWCPCDLPPAPPG